MSTVRTGSHQLSNGLMVSGRPENHSTNRHVPTTPRAVPYTGGDVKNSGELGKMVGIDPHAPPTRSGPKSGSGPMTKKTSSSSFSGPMTPIQPTGLITSGPLGSNRRSGQLDGQQGVVRSFKRVVYGSSVTALGSGEVKLELKVSRLAMWVFFVVAVMGLVVGTFLYFAVNKPVLLVVVLVVLVPVIAVMLWNYGVRRWGVMRFLKGFPNSELRGAVDGQFVKVTGVVTCGSVALETSFQKVPRCVYASSELYEYRGCGGKPANTNHRVFSWGCRHSENYVTDFYISDIHTGLRALVKAGYGAKVAPFVKSTTVVDLTKENKESSPNFMSWLSERGLSTDDRLMRLKEAHIKEGSTVSVMGVVRRHENVLMIVPPSEPISTGCGWSCCLLPTYFEGLILTCGKTKNGGGGGGGGSGSGGGGGGGGSGGGGGGGGAIPV